MKKIIVSLVSLFFFHGNILAQGVILWQKTIGGSKSDDLSSIQQTNDGGYILGGSSHSNISGNKTENNFDSTGTSVDYWIAKTDLAGNIQWENTIGGMSDDWLVSIQQTYDGGFILGGYSNSPASGDKSENNIGFYDYWIVKVDSLGNLQWQNTIGGNFSDKLNSIQQTPDDGFILGGTSDSNTSGDKTENRIGFNDYWIVKTDSLGNVLWQNTIGGINDDALLSIQISNDGGFILGGFSTSNISGDKSENNIDLTGSSNDFWVIKTDSLGTIQWQNTIGGNGNEELHSIQQTADQGFILGGFSASNISGDKTENNIDITGSTYDYWVVKIDSMGGILWQNTIGGSSLDKLYSAQQTHDGGYILGGYSASNISGDKMENSNGYWDYWIVKIDSTGNMLWQNTMGGNENDVLSLTQQTIDNGYIIGGSSMSNISGDKTENSIGVYDYWILKLYSDGNTAISEIANLPHETSFYPNPSGGEITISSTRKSIQDIEIYDVGGRIQATSFGSIQKDQLLELHLDVSLLSPGIYFVKVKTDSEITTLKFIKQ